MITKQAPVHMEFTEEQHYVAFRKLLSLHKQTPRENYHVRMDLALRAAVESVGETYEDVVVSMSDRDKVSESDERLAHRFGSDTRLSAYYFNLLNRM